MKTTVVGLLSSQVEAQQVVDRLNGVKEGGILVLVHTEKALAPEARQIMSHSGALITGLSRLE